jgi:hypothetical protein
MAHEKSKPRAEFVAAEKWLSLPPASSARSNRIDCAPSGINQSRQMFGRFYTGVETTGDQPLAFLPAFVPFEDLPERFLGGSG